MTSFEPVEPFGIDDGSLSGLSTAAVFALGVEWEMFRQKLRRAVPFTDLCLSANAARLSALAERQGRFVEHHPQCDGWATITVGNLIECESGEPEST
ncbi:MAG TPA: hypothetical protein VFG04_02710 [Planctomycetaceae bacterium]|jgi:hypothetical protein|nr:hypothetical protein [Planctomycetaceae bacterium]